MSDDVEYEPVTEVLTPEEAGLRRVQLDTHGEPKTDAEGNPVFVEEADE